MSERKIVVAMSGGVDSSVAALLLARGGWEVTGLFMRTGSHGDRRAGSCCSLEDGLDARRVADRIGIPFYALNFEREFASIIEAFVAEYGRGRTPNPCVLCNRDLKFGKLFDYAAAVGAGTVATGHYARIERIGDRRAIARARDPGKDQSYVLFVLSQEQLARTVLPLGDLTKARVREIAREAGLPVAEKPDSQEVCFVPPGGYRELLAGRGVGTPGPLVDGEGRTVGRHAGMEFFTVGQRRGLGTAFGEPRYVTGIDPASGTVRVGPREALLAGSLFASGWVGGSRPAPVPGERWRAEVRIRYRHEPAAAEVRGTEDGGVRVSFDRPQPAVTPGQAVVAYEADRVAGGGWIDRAE